jgi:tetratricopeptide (TPR) repeat protein
LTAEELNEKGRRLADEGDTAGAETAYLAAMALDPEWSAPAYNLGLMYKYQGDWHRSREYNKRATELNPDDEASWWNLGIAATALSDWGEARRAWSACGMNPPEGDGAPDFGWGMTPVRLEPDGDGEVVWARRIDPARAQIGSVPLPTSHYRWRDVVLTDGAEEGQRIVEGRVYSVFNALQLLSPSQFQTFVVELGTESEEAINALGELALDSEFGAEYWGKSTRTICRACSLGLPDGHSHEKGAPVHPHFGLAVREESEARALIDKWLERTRGADIVTFYAVPRSA